MAFTRPADALTASPEDIDCIHGLYLPIRRTRSGVDRRHDHLRLGQPERATIVRGRKISAGGLLMSTEEAAIARRWFEEVWNSRRDEAIYELMAPDAVGHMEGGDVHGPDEFRTARAAFLNALPDVHIAVEDVIAEGDRAAVRWLVRATHKGELFGVAASHRKVELRGTSWFRIRDGKLVEGWDTWNLGGLLDSLRADPARRSE
jgi:steroid delta-isomerase-like uncharacterized protein